MTETKKCLDCHTREPYGHSRRCLDCGLARADRLTAESKKRLSILKKLKNYESVVTAGQEDQV